MNLIAIYSRERAIMNEHILWQFFLIFVALGLLAAVVALLIFAIYYCYKVYKASIKYRDFELKFEKHTGKRIKFNHHQELFVKNVIFPQDMKTGWEDICVPKEIVAQLQTQVIAPLKTTPEQLKALPWQALPPKGILFYGARGTGKSLLARTLAKETNYAFLNCRSSEILSIFTEDSETIVKGVFNFAKKLEPCMIFFDDIDLLFRNISLKGTFLAFCEGIMADQGDKEKSESDPVVIVIGATSKHQNIDEDFLRRLNLNIEIPLPTLVDRILILEIQLKGIKRDGGFNIKKLATMTNGFSGAHLKEVVRHASISCIDEMREKLIIAEQEKFKMNETRSQRNVEANKIRDLNNRVVASVSSAQDIMAKSVTKMDDGALIGERISNRNLHRDSEDEDPLKLDQRLKCEVIITMAQMIKSIDYLKKSLSKCGRGFGGMDKYEVALTGNLTHPRDLDVKWKDIAGLDHIIKEIKKQIIIPIVAAVNRQKINSQLVSCPKGILFSGPPGSGKTLLAKALCYHSRCTFINLDASALQTKNYEESQKFTLALFRLAEKYQPSVIFIDEIERFLSQQRQSEGHEPTGMIKSQFLSIWDAILTDPNKIIIIMGASNRVNDIDPAVMRRLSKKFKITLPNLENRERILRMILDKENNIAPNVNLRTLATLTEGFSPAELKDMASSAAVNSLQAKVKSKDDALNNNDSFISLDLYALDSRRSLAGSWSIADGNFGGLLTVKEITMDKFLEAIEAIRKAKGDTNAEDSWSIYS